jgi:tetraacyldisaccharide 4'-kinase
MHWLERHWVRRTPVSWALLPLAGLYGLVMDLRRTAYRIGLFRSHRVPAKVVVVGNISVGGTGKTPLVAWLARFLRSQGYLPGIITRGYGGRAASWPQAVRADSDPAMVGDEPVLLARTAGCPVMADPDRVRAAQRLIHDHRCDVVLSDDGLQHYRLARDVEIAVIDGERRFGNRWRLPAGPLREAVSRLDSVDACVTQGVPAAGELAMSLEVQGLFPVKSDVAVSADHFRGQTVHAVAGIGNPARFFALLRRLGLTVIEHPFPDHHPYVNADLAFGDDAPILMTEKDAVKFERLGVAGWYLKVAAQPDARLGDLVLRRLKENAGG